MAILKISNELIDFEPELIPTLKTYFDKFVEFLSDDPSVRKFSVEKDGLPNDSTVVSCICKNENGLIKVISCK